jgi:hypothetical protein
LISACDSDARRALLIDDRRRSFGFLVSSPVLFAPALHPTIKISAVAFARASGRCAKTGDVSR